MNYIAINYKIIQDIARSFMKKSFSLYIRFFLALALHFGLQSCSSYKYGSVTDEVTTTERPEKTIQKAKEWFINNNGRINDSDDNYFSGLIGGDVDSYSGAICELKYKQKPIKDGTSVSITTGVKDIVVSGNIIVTDQEALENRVKQNIGELIHQPMIDSFKK